ncbi:MAG: dual specificity protein phosphatase family protein [Myxococcota bacterium]
MTPALPFLVVAAGELWAATATPWWAAWFLAWCGVSTGWAGVCYLARRPGWLGKGTRAAWALAPFLWWSRGSARVAQRVMREPRVEVVPGLWVGAWPRRGAPELAQLDLTAELPRRGDALRYACVPMLDGAPPEPDAFHAAVAQVRAWRDEGLPVLVHCAYGHGRSVAVVVAVLVAEGHAPGWEEAHAMVLRRRPLARMTPAQRAVVAHGVRRYARPEATGPAAS